MLQTGIQGLITNESTKNTDPSTKDLPSFSKDVVTNKISSKESPGKDSISKLKVATQLKYAMTKTRTIDHNKRRDHSDNNVENLDSNVPYIALFDPLDPEYTESLNRTDCTGNDINDTYSRMKSNSKSIETIMSLGAAACQKVESPAPIFILLCVSPSIFCRESMQWSSSSAWWATNSSST